MNIREAEIQDISQIQVIRNAVKENRLSDPALVTDKDCAYYITKKGKGWVCETNGLLNGFAIIDLREHNLWALFVHPDFEHQGIGRRLHDTMINWYFKQTTHPLWLGTDPQTRAAHFYRKAGWKETGRHGKIEIRFEMTIEQWMKNK